MNKRNKILSALLTSQNHIAHTTWQLAKASALTLSIFISTPLYSQQPANCQNGYWDSDADGGNGAWVCPQPIPGGSNPWGSPNPNGSGPPITGCWEGDPDCRSEEEDGNSNAGSGGDSNNSNTQQCLDLLTQRINADCLVDPISENHVDWDPDASQFRNGLPISQWLPGSNSGHPSNQWYNNLIDRISATYWDNPNSYAVSTTFWFEAVSYCASFPFQDGDLGSISNPTYSYCMNQAYELSFAFVPELYNWNWTVNGLSRYGISIRFHSSNDPLANWALAHFRKVSKIKQCVLLYDQEEEFGC